MTVNNRWLEAMNTVAVRGGTDVIPTHIFFAGSDNTYTGTETTITNEFIRKPLTWVQNGIDSKFTAVLTTTESVGSYLYAQGFVSEEDIGSGDLLLMAPADIGLKTNAFSVEVEGEFFIRRPII